MLERYLIEHCAPTLASLKTANLFSLNFSSEKNFDKQFNKWNCQLGKKGISLLLLHRYQQTALIYVYRRGRLQNDLCKPGVAAFLAQYGYASTDVEYALLRLKVYGDARAASKLFAKFKKCKDVYSRLWSEGRTVLQLTVAA